MFIMAKFLSKNARIGGGSCTCFGTLADVIIPANYATKEPR